MKRIYHQFLRIKNYYQGISIKNKIFFSHIIIIVVTLCTLAFFANIVSSRAIVDKAVNNSTRELELIDKNLQTLVSSVEDDSRILETDHRLQSMLQQEMDSTSDASGYTDSLQSLDIKNTLSEVISNIVQPNTLIAACDWIENEGNQMPL